MDDFNDSLGEAQAFTSLDALQGYRHVVFKDEDMNKTKLTSHLGTCCYTRISFGLRNSPVTFQCALDVVPTRVQEKTFFVHIDDVIIFAMKNL